MEIYDKNQNKMGEINFVKEDFVGRLRKDMPSPDSTDLVDPLFNALWDEIKTWDINVPEYYGGYMGGTGSHVMLLIERMVLAKVIER